MGTRLNFIPLLVALVPLSAIHLCYLLAAKAGHVPWCDPYLDSCTSISATGRHAPESEVFRATIMPSAALMLVYWALAYEWIKALGDGRAGLRRIMLAFGAIGALVLSAYVAVLEEVGQDYALQRRLGAVFFFGFTIIAQLLLTIQVGAIARAQPAPRLALAFRALVTLSALTMLVGLASPVLWTLLDDYDHIEDAIEWWVTVFVLLHYAATFFAWRASGYHARFPVLADRRR